VPTEPNIIQKSEPNTKISPFYPLNISYKTAFYIEAFINLMLFISFWLCYFVCQVHNSQRYYSFRP
jgi:hypothetical protein